MMRIHGHDLRRRASAIRIPRSFPAVVLGGLLACSPPVAGPVPPPPPGPPAPPPGPPPALPPPPPIGDVTVTVILNPAVTYQTMRGWEAVAQAGQANPAFDQWKDEVIDLTVNDLGLNRIRLEVRSGFEHTVDNYLAMRSGAITYGEYRQLRYAPVNDNADPNVINAAGFKWSEFDEAIEGVILPMRTRMAANGEQLYVNLCFVSFSASQLHADPAEYSELILATFQHMQAKYGFVPDGIEVTLEPDNHPVWRGPIIGRAIAVTGGRLAAAGYHPDFIAPSTTNMANAISYFDELVQYPGAPTYLTELAYHRYAGATDVNLRAVAARGDQYGIATGMLEHIGSGVEDLHKDLTLANASAWQQFAIAVPVQDNGAQYYPIVNNRPVIGSRTIGLRQYFRYIRFGAVRFQAQVDDERVKTVAFRNPNGGMVVVMQLSRPEVIGIGGLQPGRYGVSSTASNAAELGEVQVGTDGILRFNAGTAGVFTVYAKP